MRKLYIFVYILLLIIPLSFARTRVEVWDTISCGSQSMYPLITCKNKVEINLTSNVRLNDVVIFRNPDNITVFRGREVEEYYVLHRIIRCNKTHFITKGDNNTYDDKINHGWAVKKEDILGKVSKII